MDRLTWNCIEELLEELIRGQKLNVAKSGQRIIPHLTEDDLLQPNDFPELENHAEFRYDEGMLAGIQSTQMALRAMKQALEQVSIS